MLRTGKYFDLNEDEHIINYEFGDSLHIRYMIFFTTHNQLLVIAESKYDLVKIIKRLDWYSKDSLIQMKYQADQFKLHILTETNMYIIMTLSSLFQPSFTEKWNNLILSVQQDKITLLEALDKFQLKKDIQSFILKESMIENKENYLNIIMQGTSYQSSSKKICFDRIHDFLLWPLTNTHLITIFIDRKGNTIFFDTQNGIIPLVYKLQIIPQQILIFQNKDIKSIMIRTELNDLILILLSRVTSNGKDIIKDNVIESYDQEIYKAKVHRFQESKFFIKEIFFSEDKQNKQLLFILSENAGSHQCLSKYKVKNLNRAKKIYYIQKDDSGYIIFSVVDDSKCLILLVFEKNLFKILILSKKSMSLQVLFNKYLKPLHQKEQKSCLFPQHTQALKLLDEDGSSIEQQFQRIMSLSNQQTALLFEIPFKQGENILHITSFIYHFKNKLQKSQLRSSLELTESQIIDSRNSIINKSVMGTTSVIVLSQRIEIMQQTDNSNIDIPKPVFMDGLKGLRLYSNFLLTYEKSDKSMIENLEEMSDSQWQLQVLIYLWFKINYEEGIEVYFKFKTYIYNKMNTWVDMIIQHKPCNQYEFFQLHQQQITVKHNQFEKCLSTMALLSTTFISSDKTIKYIIEQVHPQIHEISQDIVSSITNYYIGQTSLILAQYKQKNLTNTQNKPFLQYINWKDKIQYLSLCFIIFDLDLQFFSHQPELLQSSNQMQKRIDYLISLDFVDSIYKLYTILMSPNTKGQSKIFISIFMESLESYKKKDLRLLLIFCVHYIKLLDRFYPTFNIKSIYFITSLGDNPDLTYLQNLFSIWESQYSMQDQTNLNKKLEKHQELICDGKFEEMMMNRITKQLKSNNLNQDGLLIVMLIVNKLGFKGISEILMEKCSSHTKWLFESTKWFIF